MHLETIELEIRDRVALVTLARPAKMNSITKQLVRELNYALDCVESNQRVRCLVITGQGKAFCVGQDLNEVESDPKTNRPDLGSMLREQYNPLIERLHSFRLPTVCAVNGVAAGAGANLPLSCDIVVACQSAVFIQAFSSIGLIPDSGGTWFLPRSIGLARAAAFTMLGQKITAAEAESWGLIWLCVNDEKLLETVFSIAAQLAERPTDALTMTRFALRSAATNSLAQQLELERELQFKAGHTDEFEEGVAAFLERRKPDFIKNKHPQ